MRERLIRFMAGRNGADNLSRAVSLVVLVLLVVGMFVHGDAARVLWVLAIAGLIYVYFRMFSRNIQARYAENQKFLQKWGPVSRRLHNAVLRFQDRKTHRYFKCPNCHKRLRVPKGRGKITITCPHCRTQFVRKS